MASDENDSKKGNLTWDIFECTFLLSLLIIFIFFFLLGSVLFSFVLGFLLFSAFFYSLFFFFTSIISKSRKQGSIAHW